MPAVRIDGTGRDLDRFAGHVAGASAVIESRGATERTVRWQLADRAGTTRSLRLRAGTTLSASSVRWEQPWSLAIDHAPSRVKFLLSRGPGPTVSAGGRTRELAGLSLSVARVRRPLDLRMRFGSSSRGQAHEEVALELDETRLRDLFGGPVMPGAIERVLADDRTDYPAAALTPTPAVARLLDDVLHCELRDAARDLYHEAKAMEILAAAVDAARDDGDASGRSPSRREVERLERVRLVLLDRLDAPPTLAELAQGIGMSETRLKLAFQQHFGSPVFAYLRERRLDEAHRLIRDGGLSVTQAASRVGYANPSKFAAAFRRRFGSNPSDLRL